MLSLLLQASGFSEESYIILPYEGAYNINSAVYLSRCLKHFRKDLSILVHRDSDGMYPEEIGCYVEKIEKEDNTKCFITDLNDLEMYYCNPNHIHALLNEDEDIWISLDDIENIYKECIDEIDEKSKKRFLNRKLDKLKENRGAESIKAMDYYERNKEKCINGHDMLGSIAEKLHSRFRISKKHIIRKSEYLHIERLANILLSFTS